MEATAKPFAMYLWIVPAPAETQHSTLAPIWISGPQSRTRCLANRQSLAYVYCRESDDAATIVKARRTAANIAKLPKLLRKGLSGSGIFLLMIWSLLHMHGVTVHGHPTLRRRCFVRMIVTLLAICIAGRLAARSVIANILSRARDRRCKHKQAKRD